MVYGTKKGTDLKHDYSSIAKEYTFKRTLYLIAISKKTEAFLRFTEKSGASKFITNNKTLKQCVNLYTSSKLRDKRDV